MKELSIEEKAKRYDESIKRAKDINREHSERGFKPSEDVLYIFPELAESEEEKLSKKLHECVCRAINNDKLPYEERKYISEQVIPYLENLEKQKEQNPTWSEEDEDRVMTVLYILHEVADNYNFDEWLKSLKDRMTLTNKNDFDRGYDVGISAAKFNQWKPTEEQMKSIARATNRCISVGDAKVLLSLYNDLKKL